MDSYFRIKIVSTQEIIEKYQWRHVLLYLERIFNEYYIIDDEDNTPIKIVNGTNRVVAIITTITE